MDFSSHNPNTSNALNLAARQNDAIKVRKLLRRMNPNCVDNRGWTCLHEAAANDAYESLIIILNDPQIRVLAETHEGHTALYLACRDGNNIKIVEALLKASPDIANYGSTETVTPLHLASSQGNLDLIQMLISYGAMLNVQDMDGDTPLHDAALMSRPESVALLLHAGADAEILNEGLYTAFHLACSKGCYQSVIELFPFNIDINQRTLNGDTPLMLAIQGCDLQIVEFLLQNGADPHLKNLFNEIPLDMALNVGHSGIFKQLLQVTNKENIDGDIIVTVCKPHYFKTELFEELLNYDLGPKFFAFTEIFHVTLEEIGDRRPIYMNNPPLNSYLNVCEYIYSFSETKFSNYLYLFLSQGVSANVIDTDECPPLVYLHFCPHSDCFAEVFRILREHHCNVDHCTSTNCKDIDQCIPDAFLASISSDPSTIALMLPYSVFLEPHFLLQYLKEHDILYRIPVLNQEQLLRKINYKYHSEGISSENLLYFVPTLQHLARLCMRRIIRHQLKHAGNQTTDKFLHIVSNLPLPNTVKDYLRYK